MNAMQAWLEIATRGLSAQSAEQVRQEITEHYEAAHEALLAAGAQGEDAGNRALHALGDPWTANRQYKKVLLTSAEAQVLRDHAWANSACCARPWIKWGLLSVPALALGIGGVLLALDSGFATAALIAGWTMAVVLLPGYLPVRSAGGRRVYNLLKWAGFAVGLGMSFAGRDPLWVCRIGSGYLAYVDIVHISLRRKLPTALWPKQLYL